MQQDNSFGPCFVAEATGVDHQVLLVWFCASALYLLALPESSFFFSLALSPLRLWHGQSLFFHVGSLKDCVCETGTSWGLFRQRPRRRPPWVLCAKLTFLYTLVIRFCVVYCDFLYFETHFNSIFCLHVPWPVVLCWRWCFTNPLV